jgi:hypothetical protein
MGLHEGNIVRFHLRPTEYRIWRESWRWRNLGHVMAEAVFDQSFKVNSRVCSLVIRNISLSRLRPFYSL